MSDWYQMDNPLLLHKKDKKSVFKKTQKCDCSIEPIAIDKSKNILINWLNELAHSIVHDDCWNDKLDFIKNEVVRTNIKNYVFMVFPNESDRFPLPMDFEVVNLLIYKKSIDLNIFDKPYFYTFFENPNHILHNKRLKIVRSQNKGYEPCIQIIVKL